MEGYIGQVVLFAGNFAPRGWAFCQGQLLSIAQNTALFSILGTTYGGNGQTTFGLPDLRGRVPVGTGAGPGLSTWDLGQVEGVENVSLTVTQMPAHNHLVEVSTGAADTGTASNNFLANANAQFGADEIPVNTYNGAPGGTLAANSIAITGGSQPHVNIQPSLGMNYIICTQGIFPSRN
ncbi:phage tail protein [Longitalea arenae]|uniref:phage tail protein n=1 Tax=Longitalea arenae TaxID=2812558 RepID=UPI0019687ABF|nr:tail fiber protein [Longitalea arenae]